MIASLGKRFNIIGAKLRNNRFLVHSAWGDVAHEAFKFYGRHKAGIAKRMHFTREQNGLVRVEIDGRVLFWPAEADAGRLVDMYFEVYHKGNNHRFDIPGMEVQKGDVVLDCGACEGFFTKKALEAGAGTVHSIEPGAVMGRCLRKSFERELADGRVVLHSCLIGDRNDEVLFRENPGDPTTGEISRGSDSSSEKRRARKISMLSIDELCRRSSIETVDFIKADVEGGEVALLHGAEQTIRRCRPNLAIAVYHGPENANRIVDFLAGLGMKYRVRVKGIVDFDGVPRPVMAHAFRK